MRQFAAAAALLASGAASAYTTGIAGYSGKDGPVCTECHAPGPIRPKATLSGPTALAPGALGTYTLLIDTDATTSATQTVKPRAAGLDVAATAGTLGTVQQANATRLIAGELTHTDALPAAKLVQIMFTLTAPMTPGTLTLYAAALSADGDGSDQGDGTDSTTLDVQVGMADLAGVDAISSATAPAAPTVPRDLGPRRDEPRWSCGSVVGAGPSAAAGALALVAPLVVLLLRRRRA